MSKVLKLTKLRIDGGTQSRAAINQAVVDEYADYYRDDVELPDPVVYFDGSAYWLADGFHRYHAANQAGRKELPCDVHNGTQRDAILHSCGANSTHGLKRTNADKRNAVGTMLADAEWAKQSNNWIADICGVSHTFVADVRSQVATVATCDQPKKRVGKDGKEYKVPEPQQVKSPAKIPGGINFDPASWPVEEEPEEAEAELAEPEAKEGEPLRCALDLPVPKHLEPAFARMGEFNEAMRLIGKAKAAIEALSAEPLGAFIDFTSFKADIGNARNAIKFAKPYTVCPYCKGKKCGACREQGWTNERLYKAAPKGGK